MNTIWLIPVGIYWDLMDDNANNPPGVNDGIPNDNVMGYSMNQIETMVTEGTPRVMQTVENTALNLLPTGQTTADVSNIFNQYGF